MKMDLLPAEIYSNQIRDVIGEHQTVIICGETGCGKSTVIPQVRLFKLTLYISVLV
jgi:HrpA-like RNA helicase